jgi:PPOX class probable F420-dependent enzyme
MADVRTAAVAAAVLRNSHALCGQAEALAVVEVAKSQIRPWRPQGQDWPPVLLRSTLAAKAEEQVDPKVLRESFCDAAGARASIYACTAFNTKRGPDQSAMPVDEPAATANFGWSHHISAMPKEIPVAIRGKKYISLGTFRKNGTKVPTPVWFGEDGDKLYVMTLSSMGKTKRIRNNPQVTVAPCTIRGKLTGTEVAALARILPPEENARARQTVNRKYWMARLSSPFSRADTFLEISFP